MGFARLCGVLVVLAVSAGSARADDPWAQGVSQERKASAQKLLEAGNALFLEKKYRDALDQYTAAIAQWDHPAIEFNIVRCYIFLEKPVEASEHLEVALKYGAAPLEDTVYQEALSYQKLLGKQVGDLTVSCTQAGAHVTLDGQPLIATCPGTRTRRLAIGQHQVAGVESGFLTQTQDIVVVGGAPQTASVKLVALADTARVTHRWATWKPWLVFGGGLALVAVGGGLDAIATQQMHAFDDAVATCGSTGCNGPGSQQKVQIGERDRAKLESQIGVGILAVGAAATVTGAVLLYMNRAHTVYEHATITPTAGGAALSLQGAF